jgi:hypothetical protein
VATYVRRIYVAQVIWYEIQRPYLYFFDPGPNFILEFIGDSTITQFRERLKYAAPLARCGYIDLPSLARTVKFLKIAYHLGAPCEEGMNDV